jgi:hypothetical protein
MLAILALPMQMYTGSASFASFFAQSELLIVFGQKPRKEIGM